MWDFETQSKLFVQSHVAETRNCSWIFENVSQNLVLCSIFQKTNQTKNENTIDFETEYEYYKPISYWNLLQWLLKCTQI